MPLFGPGMNPGGVDPAVIATEMRPALYAWFSGHIQLVKAGTITAQYDPRADTGGVAADAVLYDSGEDGALIQAIRAPRTAQFGEQYGAITGVRFQAKIEPLQAHVRSGLEVIVLAGGNDPELAQFTYTLKRSVDSSIAWGKIFEAEVMTTGRVTS